MCSQPRHDGPCDIFGGGGEGTGGDTFYKTRVTGRRGDCDAVEVQAGENWELNWARGASRVRAARWAT